ncbi:unnamed protein product [Linum trigynum]|uniref:Uncharacterized protein n=1 Tax=Linum trigynum TaxID=586398 RepID=A0AAV2DH01_9ROSI
MSQIGWDWGSNEVSPFSRPPGGGYKLCAWRRGDGYSVLSAVNCTAMRGRGGELRGERIEEAEDERRAAVNPSQLVKAEDICSVDKGKGHPEMVKACRNGEMGSDLGWAENEY